MKTVQQVMCPGKIHLNSLKWNLCQLLILDPRSSCHTHRKHYIWVLLSRLLKQTENGSLPYNLSGQCLSVNNSPQELDSFHMKGIPKLNTFLSFQSRSKNLDNCSRWMAKTHVLAHTHTHTCACTCAHTHTPLLCREQTGEKSLSNYFFQFVISYRAPNL